MRSAVITKKIGMTRVVDAKGNQVSVSVLSIEDCQVITNKNIDGVNFLQIGAGKVKKQRLNKPQKGFFAANKVEPRKKIAQFKVDEDNIIKPGVQFQPDYFKVGQRINATAKSKGKGFAGVMKKYNFKGGPASHGASVSHRSAGSTGGCQDPGRTFKGKKMPGHMGNVNVTVENLEIIKTDKDNNAILVKGAVPGHKGQWVIIKDAHKYNSKP